MDRFAPKTAALDTPRVDGDAIGLFNTVCMISPEMDSPAPATIAAIILGILMFHMILALEPPLLKSSVSKASCKVMSDDPTNRLINAKKITATITAVTAVIFLRLLCFKTFSYMEFTIANGKTFHKPPGGI